MYVMCHRVLDIRRLLRAHRASQIRVLRARKSAPALRTLAPRGQQGLLHAATNQEPGRSVYNDPTREDLDQITTDQPT